MTRVDVVVGAAIAVGHATLPREAECGSPVYVSPAADEHIKAGARVMCLTEALALAAKEPETVFAWTKSGLAASVQEVIS